MEKVTTLHADVIQLSPHHGQVTELLFLALFFRWRN